MENQDFPTATTLQPKPFGAGVALSPRGGDSLSCVHRDAQTGYHRVLSRYRPEGPPGPELPPGTLVFVLGRATDGGATAIHDGQVRTGVLGR